MFVIRKVLFVFWLVVSSITFYRHRIHPSIFCQKEMLAGLRRKEISFPNPNILSLTTYNETIQSLAACLMLPMLQIRNIKLGKKNRSKTLFVRIAVIPLDFVVRKILIENKLLNINLLSKFGCCFSIIWHLIHDQRLSRMIICKIFPVNIIIHTNHRLFS